MAAWPCEIVEDAGTPTGFVMPAIPDEFFVSLTTLKGASRNAAEFQHLLNPESVLDARGIVIDDVQRYALLREVASGLAFFHSKGVCVGDFSPKNLLFSLQPREAVYFIDCDTMRINDVSALPQVETPGWGVPPGEELATVYSDTYKLGLLALRLLAGDQDVRTARIIPSTTPNLLRGLIADTLDRPPQKRPLPESWTYVLGRAIEEAQHRKKTAPRPVKEPWCYTAPVDAVIYNRVWGLAAPEERRSTRDQERENRAWCKANGHNVIKVFTDEGISTSRLRKKTRDAWAELKDYLKPGHLLVCWEASRHSRDLAEFVTLRELCEQRGVKLAYKGRVYDIADGDDRFMSGLDSLISERESVIQPSMSAAVRLVATFDAVGTGQAAAGTSLSWTHTIGGAASAIVVAVDAFSSTVPTISAQVGTTPMALLGSAQYRTGADTALVYLFGLLNPPTGTQTITVITFPNEYLVGNSISYNNVTSFGAAATNSGSSASPSLSVSAATNEMVVQAFGGFTTTFAAYNQTQRYNAPWANGVNLSFLMGDAPGASTVSFTCSEANSPWGAMR